MYCNYPAIITLENEKYYVSVPNMYEKGSVNYYETYADNLEKALIYAKELLVLYLKSFKDNKKEFPKPSDFLELQKGLNKNQFITSIQFNFTYEEALVNNNIKNKTVVLPVWLDMLAQEKKINFSQVLQKALKKELNID